MSTETLIGTDQDQRAAALRSRIETAASVLNAGQVEALRATIEYTSARLHREVDGFSSIGNWISETFSIHNRVAGNIASVARLAPKFKALAEAALAGTARLDAVAYAMCKLDTTGLRVFARLPYPEGPQPSPYDASVLCTTPEETIREYCTHASDAELKAEIYRLVAALETAAVEADLSQQSLAHIEVIERGDGMWELSGLLSDDTGRLLVNFFATAAPPPRQDEADTDGVLPSRANQDAEAFHQLLASAGADPHAPKRHGHTATLNVHCDLETLQGVDTGRVATIDGRPAPIEKIRLLACEASVIPSVYDYAKGELIELGKELRLPNTALRRKLEAEQQGGCAWNGCTRPVSWCEAHHLIPWHQGGPTDADNLILLCRFHHGRLHTDRWTITKTGPGLADIRRKTCTDEQPCHACPHCRAAGLECGVRGLADVFPTGLEAAEWAPDLGDMLNEYARWASDRISEKASRVRQGSAAEASSEAPAEPIAAPITPPPAGVFGERHSELDPIPFLRCPQRSGVEGEANTTPSSGPARDWAPHHVQSLTDQP